MKELNTVIHDAFDRAAFEDVHSRSKELQNVTAQGAQALKTFEELASDVFFSLYKVSPELIEQAKVAPEYGLNFEQMSKLMESPSYQELRQYTRLDEFGAGLGSKALLEGLLKQLQENGGLKQAAVNGNQQSDTPEEIQSISGMQPKIRQMVECAADKAIGELEETERVIVSWGLNQGEFQRLPFEKKLEILKVLRGQRKFHDITKLVGRMRVLATGSRKAKIEQRVELHSITQGADINHVFPQELAALRNPALKLNFYRRMAERQLLQYDLNYKEAVGQGPIIALIDTSSSMHHGSREIWSKALALGLAEIAEREKRAFCYALFASRRDELIVDEFKLGERSPDKLLKMATEFIGGGTNFEQPLRWAMGKLRESKFSKADVVMITDGECQLSDMFLQDLMKVKQEKQFQIYSILIGGTPSELNRWSDEVWSIVDLMDENVAKELFQKI